MMLLSGTNSCNSEIARHSGGEKVKNPMSPASSVMSNMSHVDSFRLSHGVSAGEQDSMKTIGTWIYGEQSIGGRKTAEGEQSPLPLEDVRPSMCLFFTPKFYQGCCCCLKRNLCDGDIVEVVLQEGSLASAEVVYIHHNKNVDLMLDDGFIIQNVSRSSIASVSKRSTDEVHMKCGCVLMAKLERDWDLHQASRAKIRFRVGAFIFVLINIAMAILDGVELRSSSVNNFTGHSELRAVHWATAPFFNQTSYFKNPFCEASPHHLLGNISLPNNLNNPEDVSNMLVSFRSVGVILPSLCLMLFSWTEVYQSKVLQRNVFLYTLMVIVAVAVGFLAGYKFSFWYEIAHLRRGIHKNDLYPKVPGQGLLLYFMVFSMCFSPLPSIVSVVISAFALVTWFITSLYQLMIPPIHQEFSDAVGMIYIEVVLMFGLMILCFFQNWYRENYARWDYLQREMIKVKRSLLLENQQTASRLLQSMLPVTIIEKLKTGKPVMAEMYNPVTVLFAEICNFSTICDSGVSPTETVQILNEVYTEWDKITDRHAVYKVETVGEVYMAVSGCPVRIINHAEVASCCALDMMRAMDTIRLRLASLVDVNKKYLFDINDSDTTTLDAHIGLNTGRINAGVVGTNNPRFKLFGDTVNMASRMESTCPHGKIQVSFLTYRFIKNHFLLKDRGLVKVKGKGEQHTYLLVDLLPGAPSCVKPIFRDSAVSDNGIGGFGAGAGGEVKQKDIQDSNQEGQKVGHHTYDSGGGGEVRRYKSSVGRPLDSSQLQCQNFWSQNSMTANPRARLRAWSNRARVRCEAERQKWSIHNPPTTSTLAHHHGLMRESSESTSGKITRERKQLDTALSSPHSVSSPGPRPSGSGGAGVSRHHRMLSGGSHGSGIVVKNIGKGNRRASKYFRGSLQNIAEIKAQKEIKATRNQDPSSRGKIEGLSAAQSLVENKEDGSNSILERSTSVMTKVDQMMGKVSGKPKRSTLEPTIHKSSTCGKLFWPELDSNPSARRTYRMMRCLTKREMGGINFEQLQKNAPKFDARQEQKYLRQNVMVLTLFSILFILMVWYDLYQFLQKIKQEEKDGWEDQLWSKQKKGRVDKIFLRIALRTGGIGFLFMLMLFLTLFSKRIKKKTSLTLLFLTGTITIALCFETGCHADNTYFVMWACSV